MTIAYEIVTPYPLWRFLHAVSGGFSVLRMLFSTWEIGLIMATVCTQNGRGLNPPTTHLLLKQRLMTSVWNFSNCAPSGRRVLQAVVMSKLLYVLCVYA